MARYWIAQRVLTGEFLHMDLPIQGDPMKVLTATGTFRATISPDEGALRGPDGRLILEPWNTALYVEDDGEIRWGGLITDMSFDGPAWELAVANFSTYPHGQPFAGTYVGVKADPADIMRYVWAHLQGYPNGNLGVQVTGTTTIRIGTDSDIRRDAQKVVEEAAKKFVDAKRKELEKKRAELDSARKAKAPQSRIDALQAQRDALQSQTDSLQDAYEKEREKRQTLDELVREDGGSYRLEWQDNPDCGSELVSLARETGIEWVEEHEWNANRTGIIHRIRVADAIGGRRDALRFEQGVNVTEIVPFEVDGMEVATEVIAIGAGEGTKALRTTASVTQPGRVRRARLLELKDVRDKNRLEAEARYRLARATPKPLASRITVQNHGYAPFGAWDVGDVVALHANVPWLGQAVTWQRVVSWQMVTPSTAVVDLEETGS